MEFTKVVAERYSCKNFSTRKVEAEKLTEILEAGRLAPTAKNSQEQRIYVLQSEESLAKLDKVTPCRYGAPTCLVVAFDKNQRLYLSRRKAGLRHGGCRHRGDPPDAGRCQRRCGQLLAQLLRSG